MGVSFGTVLSTCFYAQVKHSTESDDVLCMRIVEKLSAYNGSFADVAKWTYHFGRPILSARVNLMFYDL
jgi:hypothetical protein